MAKHCPRRGIERNLIDFGGHCASRSGEGRSLKIADIPGRDWNTERSLLNDNEITESTTVSPLLGGRRFPTNNGPATVLRVRAYATRFSKHQPFSTFHPIQNFTTLLHPWQLRDCEKRETKENSECIFSVQIQGVSFTSNVYIILIIINI